MFTFLAMTLNGILACAMLILRILVVVLVVMVGWSIYNGSLSGESIGNFAGGAVAAFNAKVNN